MCWWVRYHIFPPDKCSRDIVFIRVAAADVDATAAVAAVNAAAAAVAAAANRKEKRLFLLKEECVLPPVRGNSLHSNTIHCKQNQSNPI